MPISSPKSFSAAFTLVELLVAMGLITILIGLLLPALFKARRSMNGITCESNLRQWAMATTMYANENHGFLPRRGQGVGPTEIIDRPSDWFNALPQILHMPQYQDMVAAGTLPRPPDASLWICPQAQDMPGTYYWSYGLDRGGKR